MYERIINDGLLTRIDALLKALNAHKTSTESPDELVFQSLIESAGDPSEDQPPPPPEGVHTKITDRPTYSRMMAALVDDVKKEVDVKKPDDRLSAFIDQVGVHRAKVLDLQQQLLKRLAELEKLEGSKITSESIKFGFNSSQVSKSTKSAPDSTHSVELLNPKRSAVSSTDSVDSGADADIEDDDASESMRASALGKAFGKIRSTDYQASLNFISQHPSVLASRETDGLLLEAFDEQSAGNSEAARQCVHQALLLQYCRSLGRDGVNLFFKRVTTKGHQAHTMFYDDVNSTYARLRDRALEMGKERADELAAGEEGVEQIQLHAVNPGQKIAISIPSADDPAHAEARKVFESFPPGLQRALQSGELDEVNKVLGHMSVDEAEEVVGQLSEGGMLSVEEGIIDATTEEGKAVMKEIEESGKMPGIDPASSSAQGATDDTVD